MRMSLPVNANCLRAAESSDRRASAAKYSPTGHPSVCSTSAATTTGSKRTPQASKRLAASPASMARSSIPISTRFPCDRSSGVEMGSGFRDASATQEPAGSRHGS